MDAFKAWLDDNPRAFDFSGPTACDTVFPDNPTTTKDET